MIDHPVDGSRRISRRPGLAKEVFEFHGHECPGAALGIRASELALELVGHHSKENQVVAVVEASLCDVDPIQYLTGCTFGKRNLIHRDHGKRAFSFWRLSDDTGVRIVATVVTPRKLYELHDRIHEGSAAPEDVAYFEEMQRERQTQFLNAPLEELFKVETIATSAPSRTKLTEHLPCDECGEDTAKTHLRRVVDKELCPPCLAARGERDQA